MPRQAKKSLKPVKFNRLQVMLLILFLALLGLILVYKTRAASNSDWVKLLSIERCSYNYYGIPATLSKGSTGACVTALQTFLRHGGSNLTVDGKYGDVTKLVVVAFQKENGLKVDGIVGLNTWIKLKSCVRADANDDGRISGLDLKVNSAGSIYGWGCFKIQ